MDPSDIYETVEARRPVIEDADLEAEARAINKADQRDGTNAFLEAAWREMDENEPPYEW